MKSLLRFSGLLAVLMIVAATRATAQPAPPTIAKIEIKHVGPQAVSDELIRANIRVKVGDPYLPTAVDEDVRNLYAKGFFYNIQVTEDRTRDGIILTYIVQGKPRLTDVKFSGNKKFSEAKLRKKLTSKAGEPLDEHKLFDDSQEIQKLYQKSGYPNTEVKYVLNIDETTGRGTATFEIKESPKVRIKDVQFVGARAFSQKKLRKTIKTRRHWMFSWLTSSGVLKEEQFEDDREKLAEFYRDKGYIDFEIKDVKFEHPTPATMVIKFVVFEGNPYKVGAVTFKGATLLPTNVVSRAFKSEAKPPKGADRRAWFEGREMNRTFAMKEGAVFTPKGLNKDVEAVEDFYGARGYIDVSEGSGNLNVEKVPNVERGTMDLQFDVKEGQPSYVEKIEIRGNTKTKDKVIRRELAVSPGDVFDMVRVKLSKQRLEGLQYFEKVDAKPEPTDVPNRKNLVVGVEEKSTGNFMVGAGFSSVESLVGYVDVSQGNFDLFNPPTFTGAGQKARLHVALGTQERDVEVSFIEPWFLDQRLSLGVDLYHRELDYESLNSLYNENRTGGRVSLTKDLWQNRNILIGSLSYTLEDVGIVSVSSIAPPAITSQAGHSLLSRVRASLAYDTRNSYQLPNSGQRIELSGEVVGGPFAGGKNYYKLEFSASQFFKGFFTGHVLEMYAKTGVAGTLGGTSEVPFYDRYYLGGMYSLRGYKYRDVGPKEWTYPDHTEQEPIGGDTYWFGSAEYSIPIIERLRFALFYDVGNVCTPSYQWKFGDYTDDWGIGLRLNLPMGPLRLDYGIPIKHDSTTSGGGKFQFGVGYSRPF